MKIIFIGTPEFGAIILEKIVASSYTPVAVVAAPDKPVGRKQIVTPPPVKLLAERYDIPVIQPERIGNWKLEIENWKPELIVVAAYGQILPKDILDIPKYGCLNVHPSLLPKYRGATPIQTAILNGEKETGVSIILMDERIDTGPILSQNKTLLGRNETAEQLNNRLAVLGSELLIDTIPDWIEGKIKLRPQDEKLATYTKTLVREDSQIDWRKKPEELDRQIRAFNPWPGTYTIYKKRKIKILKARLEKNKLIIERVQLEGKKPTAFEDFKRGHSNFQSID